MAKHRFSILQGDFVLLRTTHRLSARTAGARSAAAHWLSAAVRLRAMRRLCAAVALLALGITSQAANACTSFILRSADGGVVYGRTLEFGVPMESEILIVPRHMAETGTGPSGTAGTGLAWTTKYGAVGMNGFGLPVLVDGMNEAGLAGGLLYLPGIAEYEDVAPARGKDSIASYELLTYVLTNYATVAEAKAGIAHLLVNRSIESTLKMPAPLHLTLHDITGASLVVEYIGGKLTMYDNPTGVMTNAPAFSWHLANLGNYLSLSVYDPAPMKIGSLTISPPSTGAGAAGLPGDMSSPSRFVRAFMYSQAAPEQKTSAEAVDNAFHILNNFDITPGVVRTLASQAAGGGANAVEITEWMDVADLKAKKYYIRTYENSQTQMMDLTKVDFDAKAIKLIPISQPGSDIDITP
jgi:choloylglycine hydrolase